MIAWMERVMAFLERPFVRPLAKAIARHEERPFADPVAEWRTPLGSFSPTRRDIADGLACYEERYFVTWPGEPEREVTQDEYVRTERLSGFRPKAGCGPTATASFSSHHVIDNVTVSGRTETRWLTGT